MTLRIRSNYHRRPIDFSEEGFDFFTYCGRKYLVRDFSIVFPRFIPRYWNGILTEDFVGGVLIHLTDDGDSVVVATYTI